jgi:hypothetical protein
MKHSKLKLFLGLGFAAGLVSCSIPKPECTVGATSTNGVGLNALSAFAVRYKLVSGTGECANFKGEVIGFQSYHPASADGKTRDFSKTSVALRTQSLGELAWMAEDLDAAVGTPTPNALGDFASNVPDDKDFCQVSPSAGQQTITAEVNFKGATIDEDPANYPFVDDSVPASCMADADCKGKDGKQNLICDPDAGACVIPPCAMDADCSAVKGAVCRVDMGMSMGACVVPNVLPPTDLKYEWSNLQFYVTAAATGTQMTADVKITLNGCEATYKAIGMWPAVNCAEFLSPDATESTTTECSADADCASDMAHPTCLGAKAAKKGKCSDGPNKDKECSTHADCSDKADDPVQCAGAKPEVKGVCAHQCTADTDCKKSDFNKCDPSTGFCSHQVTGADLCNPAPDAPHGLPIGSGINPDFGPVACQTDVAVVPVVDQYHSLPDQDGAPISAPRCTLQSDTIPALDASKNPYSSSSGM